jgi:L-2-hydroxycarboxylate dehydrogenase (NAD+)
MSIDQDPMTSPTVLVTADQERDLVLKVLRQYGASVASATTQAEWLVEADLRGHSSHGIDRLPILVARIERGLLIPDAKPELSWRTGSVLSVNGSRGFGPVVAQHALEVGIERARSEGIVLIAISNANHLGILAPYVEQVAAAGMIGIASTTSEALVHPWGGRVAMVGTNPLAIAIPAEPLPFVLDMATGQISMGRILHYLQLGRPLEPGWAVDVNGDPTTDPLAASQGAISPFGGPKGFALGLALEVLIASLTGTALGQDVHGTLDADDECNKGDVFICINQTLVAGESVTEEISKYLDDVRSTPAQPGSAGVRIPGERAVSERARRRAMGVEVSTSGWEAALALASGSSLRTIGSSSGEGMSERNDEPQSSFDETVQ